MIRRRNREHAIYSARQRVLVLTFDTVADAMAFDALNDDQAGRAIATAIVAVLLTPEAAL